MIEIPHQHLEISPSRLSKKTTNVSNSYSKNSSVEKDFISINNEISKLKFEESDIDGIKEKSSEQMCYDKWENREIWFDMKKDDSSSFREKIADFSNQKKIKNLKKSIKIDTQLSYSPNSIKEVKSKTTTATFRTFKFPEGCLSLNYCNPNSNFDYTNYVEDNNTADNINLINSINTNYNDLLTINHRNNKKLFKTFIIPTEDRMNGKIRKELKDSADFFKNSGKNNENTLLSTNDSNNESFDTHFKNYTAGQNKYERTYFNYTPKKLDFNNSYINPLNNARDNPPYLYFQIDNVQPCSQTPSYNFISSEYNSIETKNCGKANLVNSDIKLKKERSKREDENTFYINEENIINGKDKRTNIMIKNIPNKYNITALLDEINFYYKGKFDFLYLPLDLNNNNCNLGFAFINFLDPLHILMFLKIFSKKKWKKFNSLKQCELAYAKFQGKKELTSHFEKTINSIVVVDEKNPYIIVNPKVLPSIEIPLIYLNLCKKYMNNLEFEVINEKFVIRSFSR